MVIFLNPYANNGSGMKKWMAIEPIIKKYLKARHSELIVADINRSIDDAVKRHSEQGRKVFVAAGGDGTVNIIANAIMKLPQGVREKKVLGAIGLGSSNDFHKPFSKDNIINNIPVRLDYANPVSHNAGLIEYKTEQGILRSRFFIVNSSMGILAEANQLFNHGDLVIRRLKSYWVNGTINYTAVKSLLSYKNKPASIFMGTDVYKTHLTNLSVVINPHFTGSYKYNTPVGPESDYMCANLLEDLNRTQRLSAFYRIGQGHFTSVKGARSWNVQSIKVVPDYASAIEIDGETFQASEAVYRLCRRALAVCC